MVCNLCKHSFPKDEAMWKTWTDALDIPPIKDRSRAFVCSDHFTNNCFNLRGKVRRLLKTAIPMSGSAPHTNVVPVSNVQKLDVTPFDTELEDQSATLKIKKSSVKWRSIQRKKELSLCEEDFKSPEAFAKFLDYDYQKNKDFILQKRRVNKLNMKLTTINNIVTVLSDRKEFETVGFVEVRRNVIDMLSKKSKPISWTEKTFKDESDSLQSGDLLEPV